MRKNIAAAIVLLVMGVQLFAAAQQETVLHEAESRMAVLGETDTTVTFREATGNIVELPKDPERAVVTLNSILDLWYMAGGTSLAKVKGTTNVPEEALDLPVLGTISTINSEMIMELEPDFLVVSATDTQVGIRDLFEAEGIPGVSISYSTYDDFRVILDLFTRLNSTRDLYEQTMIPYQRDVQSIINQAPEDGPTVCILFSSTRYVKVETQNTIAGYFCEQLGAENIYRDDTIEGATRVELSLEYILEQDPDIIFATTMGDIEKCRERIQEDIIDSDIWGDLTAVKNGRFYYLDKDFSIYKPNRFYPEAFKTMAEYLYPGVPFTFEER